MPPARTQSKLQTTSKITAKGQLTLPKPVREVLGVTAGDRVRFVVENGVVTVEGATAEHADPAIGAFLTLIEKDIAAGRNLRTDLPADVMAAMQRAMEETEIDLDETLTGEVAL